MVAFGLLLYRFTKSLVPWFPLLAMSKSCLVSSQALAFAMEVIDLYIIFLWMMAHIFFLVDHTGQCLAHFIMGSSFVGYGILMLLSLRVGGPWLLRRGKSQEWYDSWVIMLWGIVNTFTEHR